VEGGVVEVAEAGVQAVGGGRNDALAVVVVGSGLGVAEAGEVAVDPRLVPAAWRSPSPG
jgi:hypothetical protein